ncbi:hypothetical protein Dimus_032004, partial [Dionaea muscipula]
MSSSSQPPLHESGQPTQCAASRSLLRSVVMRPVGALGGQWARAAVESSAGNKVGDLWSSMAGWPPRAVLAAAE